MKIVMVSDTHNKLDEIEIPEGDILLHAGDSTMMGRPEELHKFNQDLGKIKNRFTHGIVCIAGNHDWGFQRDSIRAQSYITNATYLEDSFVIIEGKKIYGSPWTPFFFNWAFNLKRGKEIKEKWDLIPDDTDILITHGPPFGILDLVQNISPYSNNQLISAGCEELLNRVVRLTNMKLNVFGHLHMNYGSKMIGNTNFVNAACLNDSYKVAHAPIIYDI